MTLLQWVFILIVVVLVIEIIAGWHRGVYRREDWFVTGGCFLVNQLLRPLVVWLQTSLLVLLLPGFAGALSGVPFWPGFLGILLVGEFCFYWVHRLAHQPVRLPLLWGLHRTHHSAKYLNVTVMSRVNVFWPFVVPFGWVTALALYLGMAPAAVLFFAVVLLWNTFTHSAFRWDDLLVKNTFGRHLLTAIEWVFITPRLHHCHHGWGKDGKLFRNYATILSIFDRLFGTLYIPSGRPEKYGTPYKSEHWLGEIFYPLVGGRK